ncbi:hypothetical protein [Ammoniphilus sp. 3BR4]|uniref:hypothetical protein n=1 Tax=Ammoniphilus sp. 3BR4 TaxID=3158265 RepID=UPI0034650AA3
MVALFGIAAVIIGIAILEIPTLWKQGWKREMGVFCFLLLLGAGLSIAESLQIDLPNPQDAVTAIYAPITKALFGLPK